VNRLLFRALHDFAVFHYEVDMAERLDVLERLLRSRDVTRQRFGSMLRVAALPLPNG